MTEQYNREQKIVEIRKRWGIYTGESDVMFLLSEIDRLQNSNNSIQAFYNVRCERIKELELSIKLLKDEKMANIQELTIQHQREVDRLQQQKDAYYENAKYTEAAFHEVTKLRAERDKAIERYDNLVRAIRNGYMFSESANGLIHQIESTTDFRLREVSL